MKCRLAILCLVSIFFVACSKEKGEIMIKVVNETGAHFTDVRVFSFKANGTEVDNRYGSVSPGASTGYSPHEIAYNSPFFRINVEGFGIWEVKAAYCGNGFFQLSPGNYSLIFDGDINSPDVRLRRD